MSTGPPRRPRLLGRRVPAAEPDRARLPETVGPSAWLLPDPSEADDDGVVGVGADLAPATLVDAYRRGIFPWPHPGIPLPWFSPDPRGVLRPHQVHVSRSLRRTLRRSGWHTTVDRAFGAVVANCADRRDEGTWITPAMQRAYRRLHELGWAHSIEVWDDHALVGGLYGVQIGATFTGESMFHAEDDASKVALVDLADRFVEAGGRLVDVQLTTPHLRSMGAVDLPRDRFLRLLGSGAQEPVQLRLSRAPVARLADRGR